MKIRRIILTVILAAAIVVVLVLVIWFRVFTLQTINVTGASLYPEETVTEEMTADEKSWNTLYVYSKYKDGQMTALPYLDGVEVKMSDPHTLKVTVTEKEALGYIYDEDAGQYVAFDADGLVLKISEEEIEGEIRIRGLDVDDYELYKTMELSDSSVLDSLQSVLVQLESYDFLPDSIMVRTAGTILLDYGNIQVNLGTTNYLNEKIVRLVKLWEKIEDRTGTLHLETWTETTTDVHFRKKELLDLDDPDATYETTVVTETDDEASDEDGESSDSEDDSEYDSDYDADDDSDSGDESYDYDSDYDAYDESYDYDTYE